MAHLQRFSYPGFGEEVREEFWYSQAIRVGDRIECAGQGGWDAATRKISPDLAEEIAQTFDNVDMNLKHAGGKGWSQVFRVNIYTTKIDEEFFALTTAQFRKWMPDHQPIYTVVGVTQLGIPEMHIEVEVSAHDEEGAKAAQAK